MKKIATFLTIYFISTNILLAKEKKCSDIKKFSKEFLSCTAENIKEISSKKTKEIKKSVEIKSNKIKDGTIKIGNKIKDKLIKKE